MSLEQQIDRLLTDVAEIKAKLASAGQIRVAFMATSSGGIALQVPVEKTGTLLSTSLLPVGPGQLQPMFVVKPDDASQGLVITDGIRLLT